MANTLVPSVGSEVYEFNSPILFAGLTGGAADDPILSENAWPADTYERVSALPVTPGSALADAPTDTTIEITWNLDVEFYVRQAGLERVAFFTVEQSLVSGGPFGDPFLPVSPAEGVPNVEDPTTPGKVRFQATGLTPSTAYFFRVKATDQYGMESLYAAEVTTSTTA